jgi:hypothetical protein
MDEVNELTDQMHGGNAAAQHIWLGNAPPCGKRYQGGSRPKEGDRIEIFKQFVLDAYEMGKFKADTPYVPGSGSSSSSISTVTPKSSPFPSPVKRSTAPALIDEDHHDANQPMHHQTRVPSSANRQCAPSAASHGFDAFGGSGSGSDPFASSSSSSSVGFDPFGETNTKPKSSAAKKPVAPSNSVPQNVSLIDFSDPAPAASQKSTTTSSSKSIIDDFASFNTFDHSNTSSFLPPAPSQQQQQQHQHHSFQAPPAAVMNNQQQHLSINQPRQMGNTNTSTASFDPFGTDMLLPVSGNASPIRPGFQPTTSGNSHSSSPAVTSGLNHGFPSTSSFVNGNGAWSAGHSSSNSPATSMMQSQQQPQTSSGKSNNTLDLFSGMTYDPSPNSSGKVMGGGMMQGMTTPPMMMNRGASPMMPAMHNSTAISQIDVFANMNISGGSGHNSATNSGRYGTSGIASGGRGNSTNTSGAAGNQSFDFVQEAMKKQQYR